MKIGAMYRVKCHNNMLNDKIGILVETSRNRMDLLPCTLMLDGRMYSFAKDELIPVEDV